VVHEAVAIPDRILVQLAEMPDGTRYVSMAKGLVKPSGSYARPPRRYAVALGCEERTPPTSSMPTISAPAARRRRSAPRAASARAPTATSAPFRLRDR
jgi:hypothetical protein